MNDATLAPEPTTAAPKPSRAPSKSTIVAKLLSRARGATVAELQEATGWQPHSARALLSHLRRGGRTLLKEERRTGETSYRLAPAAKAASVAPE